jgi:hypothetical protein
MCIICKKLYCSVKCIKNSMYLKVVKCKFDVFEKWYSPQPVKGENKTDDEAAPAQVEDLPRPAPPIPAPPPQAVLASVLASIASWTNSEIRQAWQSVVGTGNGPIIRTPSGRFLALMLLAFIFPPGPAPALATPITTETIYRSELRHWWRVRS